MAYWGLAVNSLGNSLASAPSANDVAAAVAGLDKARAIGARTPRERDWIEAIGVYYRDADGCTPGDARLLPTPRRWSGSLNATPTTSRAWAYYALTLQASAPRNDKTYGNQLKSAEILERLVKQSPEHPGVAHYLVHAYDYPPLAAQGHRHREAVCADRAGRPARPSHAIPHLFDGRDVGGVHRLEPRPRCRSSPTTTTPPTSSSTRTCSWARTPRRRRWSISVAALPRREYPILANFTAVAVVPARYALERADWAGAAALPVVSTGRAMADALARFARGLGMARSGDLAGARREVQALQDLHGALEKSSQSYWAERTEEQIRAVSAWVAYAEGAREQATKLMRAAADAEDASIKHVAMENRLYPMRELLGELLLEVGQPAAALGEFETSLKENPNRYRAWPAPPGPPRRPATGRGPCLLREARGLSGKADTPRPELAHAKAFLRQR